MQHESECRVLTCGTEFNRFWGQLYYLKIKMSIWKPFAENFMTTQAQANFFALSSYAFLNTRHRKCKMRYLIANSRQTSFPTYISVRTERHWNDIKWDGRLKEWLTVWQKAVLCRVIYLRRSTPYSISAAAEGESHVLHLPPTVQALRNDRGSASQ